MTQKGCLFCRIVEEKKVPFVYEQDLFIVIKDIAPKAPVHLLIIPKIHIENLVNISDNDWKLVFDCVRASNILSKKLKVDSFNLIANNGIKAGQSVFHLHWHFLSGINIYENGLTL
jgi:diadenosine tetraphosphate (Ap4A) HIT family hydrolase